MGINNEVNRDATFYARVFWERSRNDKEQLEKTLEELRELIEAIETYLPLYKANPKIKYTRTAYEPIILEAYDVFILILQLTMIFEDSPMWQQGYIEKVKQWREYLDLEKLDWGL